MVKIRPNDTNRVDGPGHVFGMELCRIFGRFVTLWAEWLTALGLEIPGLVP